MTKLRTRLAAAAATAGLGVGMLFGATPKAEAAVACMPAKPTISCSKYWANRITPANWPTPYSISSAQRALTQAGFKVSPINGKRNASTVAQLKAYQKSRGLGQTGVINVNTIKALRAGKGVWRPAPVPTQGSKAVTFASKQLGRPYRYGASGPSAYDCSGLTGASWKAAGKSLPRTSYAQLSKGKAVSKSALRPGDVVGFYGGGHVGLYVGNGYVIHASKPGKPVAKVKVSSMPFHKAVRF